MGDGFEGDVGHERDSIGARGHRRDRGGDFSHGASAGMMAPDPGARIATLRSRPWNSDRFRPWASEDFEIIEVAVELLEDYMVPRSRCEPEVVLHDNERPRRNKRGKERQEQVIEDPVAFRDIDEEILDWFAMPRFVQDVTFVHDDESKIPRQLFFVPGMLSTQERQMLYYLARHDFAGEGVIADMGTYLGSSTMCFAAGLRERSFRGPIIHTYDLFKMGASGPEVDHFPDDPPADLGTRSVFEENLREYFL